MKTVKNRYGRSRQVPELLNSFDVAILSFVGLLIAMTGIYYLVEKMIS
jgi:hypothetical protein